MRSSVAAVEPPVHVARGRIGMLVVWAIAIAATAFGVVALVGQLGRDELSEVTCASVTRLGPTGAARCDLGDQRWIYVNFAGFELPHDRIRGVITPPAHPGESPVITIVDDRARIPKLVGAGVFALAAPLLAAWTLLARRPATS